MKGYVIILCTFLSELLDTIDISSKKVIQMNMLDLM